MKKNGYNGDASDLLCAEAPSTWIARRLVADLRAAGIEVLEPPREAPVRIEGTLLQFFTEPKIEAFQTSEETDIHVRLRVTTSDGLVAKRDLYVKGVESAMTPTDETIQASVDDAGNEIAHAMATSVLSLLDHPLGSRRLLPR